MLGGRREASPSEEVSPAAEPPQTEGRVQDDLPF